jgi:ubiquinone/menaquinone biosynthesis C-methylase UbiE
MAGTTGATAPADAKRAAVEQWTADPCGPSVAAAEPGSRAYFERLLEGRHEYAPWMTEAFGYERFRGRRVLDVGCGQGIDLANFALGGAEVTGIDLTPRHVELARSHLAALGLEGAVVEGDAEAMPFEDGSFYLVSSNGVLHHTPDMGAALREIRRVLRPGGETRITLYNKASLHYWVHQVLSKGILRGQLLRERSMGGVLSSGVERSSIGARPLVRVYSPGAARAALRDAGFRDVESAVHHFRASDTIVTGLLAPRVARLRDPAFLERIGGRAGWYVLVRGTAP